MRGWEYKLRDYERALATLRELRDRPCYRFSDLEIAGAIQRFRYTQELAWKVLQAFMRDRGVDDRLFGSRDTIDAASGVGLIADPGVLHDMDDKRNLSSHSYNQDVAHEIFDAIVPRFLPTLEAVAATLRDKRSDPT